MVITYGLCYAPKKDLYGTDVSSLNTFFKAWLLDAGKGRNYRDTKLLINTWQISIPIFSTTT